MQILPALDLTQKIPLSNQCFEMKSSEYFTERCFGFHLGNAISCSCSISRDCGRMKISALMHITPENVRVTAHRAKKDLKKILEKEFPYK